MAQKKRKGKISSIKRNNQLRTKLIKQGKLKTNRNRAKRKRISKPVVNQNVNKNEEEEVSAEEEENVLDMIEEEDMTYLKNAVANKSVSFLKHLKINSVQEKPKRKKRKADDEDLETYETEYEQSVENSGTTKKKKYLLPIKTSEGIVVRSEEVADSGDEEVDVKKNKEKGGKEKENKDEDEEEEDDEDEELKLTEETEEQEEMSVADLLAQRQNALMRNKFRIGSLCSGLTENPEVKIKNFRPLLEMLTVNDPEVCITIKKIALVSLLEVFKDLIPAYQIRHHKDPTVKLKKVVRVLHNYENDLLKYYKEYLKKLEKIVSVLKRKKGESRIFKEPEIKLGEMAMKCLCELLTTHPYFNFSKNIIHLLVPFLKNGRQSVREMVSAAMKDIFKTDKRGEVSLEIVRNINKLVKSKKNIVHCEVLTVCLALKLKDINLDKEKEEELKKKKESGMKFVKLSKRERKRKKKFKNLENELLETKAEENKKSKERYMTEITKILFTIYFRILKVTPSSKLLNAALEGLAKFAHCINIDFYQDLITVLGSLIQNEDLKYKEKLCCVQTVFTVLYYQGATIGIDPIKFYSHFYANILQINAGKNHSDLPIILKTTDFVLLKRRKHVSLQKLLAFTKRLTALALQVLPNGSIALLSSVKQILQVNNSTDLMLDLDCGQGQGVYYPEMDEPEYCNASATALWELLPLQRHYHPTVQEFATLIAKAGHKAQEGPHFKSFLKQSPELLFEEFDPTNVKFNPAVAPPREFPKNKRKKPGLANEELEAFVQKTLRQRQTRFNNSSVKSATII